MLRIYAQRQRQVKQGIQVERLNEIIKNVVGFTSTDVVSTTPKLMELQDHLRVLYAYRKQAIKMQDQAPPKYEHLDFKTAAP